MNPPNFRTFDLNLLRVFDEVMAERSLTRAAHNLSLTQPAVSNALRRLRESLDDELVRRNGQNMEPTPQALALWPTVREALRQLQTALAPSTFEPAEADDSFVLAMADATAAELMPGLVRLLEAEAPGVSLHVLPLASRDPRKLLEDESLDLAVGFFPAVLADLAARAQVGKGIPYAHQRLYDGHYVCAMRSGHPLAQGTLSLDQFCAARHLLVSFAGRSFGFIDEALALIQRKRRVVLTVNQFFTAGYIASQTDLLTVLPQHFARVAGSVNGLVQQALPFEVPAVHVDALWHRRMESSPAHQWLRQAVARAATLAYATDNP
ncbi:DNA-binding transcriptional LysR family regulator [Rhodoferax ferrireducens]|uniref:DNA-binding transcriptional LysR family regulator n=1 Tax=Rhodoferax ferrireducens TaxID=192843 RepID=A0ABU2CC05_9BURK|nr:LysR family transcriptional regulator [Rhodoferax ferrireducens]MDR7378868.1 DNA-binding transcriptional LysR family regulator [Rhodoferax ferrireducens]